MKWTVLSDNRSSDSCLSTEHGLSILLTTELHKILLDTGASDVFIRNAELLGVDIFDVDYVFISHGHSDHAGGLRHFLEHNQKAKVIVSPDAISGRFFSKRGNLHSITTECPEIATIIFLVAFTDFLPFISKITDPLYLPLKRGGPVCPYLESPRKVFWMSCKTLSKSCNSLSISLFRKQANCLSLFRGDGRGVR